MRTKRFLLAAVLAAIAFTFSGCGSDSGSPTGPGDSSPSVGGGSSGGGGGSSGGGGGGSSSSAGSSSSGVGPGGISECDPGGTNPTVEIGGQTWMKCNLNVASNPGNGNSWCYAGNDYSIGTAVSITAEKGCAKYGRLYDWAAAMDLPSKCNSTLSTSDPECAISSPRHKGLCPVGFHVPTNAEWDALVTAVGGSSTADRYLKAQSGWFDCGPEGSGKSYLCEDARGFSALPGGGRYTDGSFLNAGNRGYWWSADERDGNYAYYRYMDYLYDFANWSSYARAYGFSVRCLQD
jgi:uncharacterized protein (TIGR02145 family)